ncbi:protein kinase [Chitinophaga sp. G-6-1-13]|uniref:Protein kinase n=1 Tax=Chitinophaga fulva TaxID=2728842 RepID=A0A848GPB6_9BACT|nr:protein kinase [Chitinophaga fulva]NML38852.1 protein kinase [Chitinophaga fulva]
MINELKETHNQNVDQQNGFHHLLDEMSIPYQEDEFYLNVGEIPGVDGWVLFLTMKTDCIDDLIKQVCPILYAAKVSFSLIKDRDIAGRKNDFLMGPDEVGKILVVFTIDEHTTKTLIGQLNEVTRGFRGPCVNNTIRIGQIIYVTRIKHVEKQDVNGNTFTEIRIDTPNVKKLPFYVEPKFRYWKTKRILKWRYVPLIMLNRSPKGDLLKSVDLKGLKFNWCFIKEGKYQMFEDRYGRTIKERLQWQAKALQELDGYIPIPKFIDYFEQGEDSYLVMEFLEGIDLYTTIEKLYQRRNWRDLQTDLQYQLLEYYLEVLEIMAKMHAAGYAHRDATAANFMILNSGEVYTIDLELSYNFRKEEPKRPFGLGVFGYVSPEQILHQNPSAKEDIYAMGALLLHVLTGKHPGTYLDKDGMVRISEVMKAVEEPAFLEIILRCFEESPQKRPELEELKQMVKKYVSKN